MSKLCLIDAYSLCYRAFFAIKGDLRTSYGQPTNAVYGFVNMLNRILDDINADYLGICFDTEKPTFREKRFKEYKIQRKPMPQELKSQIPLIRKIISAYNIPILEEDGFEADDIIAALTLQAKAKGYKVVIVTGDKDMLQLLDSDVRVYNPYKGEGIYFSPQQVKDIFGVAPENIIDFLALTGDSVDNIPGVKGIGEKTAKQLLQRFRSIDNLFDNIDKIKPDRIKELIRQNKQNIKLSRELIRLSTLPEVNFDLQQLSRKELNHSQLYEIFSELEFKSLLKNINKEALQNDSKENSAILNILKQSSDFKQLQKELNKTDCFSFFFNAEKEKLSVYIYAGKDTVYILQDIQKCAQIFNDKNLCKIGYDIKNAKLIFDKFGLRICENYFDIMIAAYLISSARVDYQISTLIYDYLKIGPLSEKSLNKKEALYLYKLKDKLLAELKQRDMQSLFYKLEMPLLEVLFRMEKNGIKIDGHLLHNLSQDLHRQIDGLAESIYRITGKKFNINSPKQLREILFNELKLPIIKKTKTGPSTDEEVLRKLSSRHEIPSLILEYRQMTKLKSTYIDVLPNLYDKKTQKIHSNFSQIGTETGRLSSNNPNLQNIPVKTELGRVIRSAFVSSSEGWLLLSCDYSQIELRILAHLSKDNVLIKAFRENQDIHRTTASLIFQVDVNSVEDQMRELAKRVNFGVIYGMSAYGLSKDLDISVEQAQDFIDTYFLRYPQVKDFIEEQIQFARQNGYVSTIMGRRRYLPYINSNNNNLRQFSERQAVNASIQGSAADLIKLAMIDIQKEIDNKRMKSRMVLQVHDELVFDFPVNEKDILIAIVKKGMEEAIKLDVPIKVALKIGKNWAQMQNINIDK